jgi:bifunctional non-homologous end joining protein LigD
LPGKSRKLENVIQPMLAKESEVVFDDKEWIYEIKWDGYRAIAEVDQSQVLLYSRNGNAFNDSYPIVADALKKMKINAVLDGEIIVLGENGDPSFQLLQHYESHPHHPIQYYVFDVLSINGTDTTDLPLLERKALLKKLITKGDVIKYSDHIEEHGIDFFEVAKERNLEGIMAKKADSLYHPGARTREWLKIKHHQSQEAIITGFTEPAGSRNYFGALVLGIKEGKELKYVGHTGSGFDQVTLKKMHELLKPLIQKASPFKEKVKTNMPVTWVKPVLVCEIKYTEFTRDGHMRHPIFLRLRQDKKANQVTMEATEKIKKTVAKKTSVKKSTKPVNKKTEKKEETLSFGKTKVTITNTSKLFWAKEEITKGDVINYYQQMADYILPYLKGRPQSLFRTPNGFDKPGFFHKDAGEEGPDWIKSVPLFSESANKNINYIICDNKQTLAYLNNLGCIELNPWHSTIKALDKPDYLIIDLDPSSKNTFEQVIETANVVKVILDKAGANCFCKTSGATGLHIYIPMQKKYTYDQVKDFAHLICVLTQEQLPKFTSLERNLKKRGNNMIYLDHLQNRKGQTIACVYSLRPKAGATVSTPLLWKEVKHGLTPQDFTIETIFKRIKKTGDIFTGILDKGIDLAKCLKRLDE